MKLTLVFAVFSIFFIQPAFSTSSPKACKTDADCVAGYQICKGGKCVWLRYEDEEIFNLGVVEGYNLTVPGPVKKCGTCIVKLSGETICKDDGKPVGNRTCTKTIYE